MICLLPVFGNKGRGDRSGARSSSSSGLRGVVSGQDRDAKGGLKVVFIRLTLVPTNCPLRPVDPEHGTEHHQKQGHLQQNEEQEVDAAQQGPLLSLCGLVFNRMTLQ